jgi:NADH-quinone oxidoreductase subunit C
VTLGDVPGVVETREAHGETTVVVDPARLVEACTYLRDAEGFDFLSDLSAVDYLGWGEKPVAGYWGSASGRDLNAPGAAGHRRVPAPKPKRFAVNYHLLRVSQALEPRRVRVQIWLDEGETPQSVVSVWPTADWHEREAWDMMGIGFDGHPNLVRILMSDDWVGHPLRKDYPIGGEPVRFSDAE